MNASIEEYLNKIISAKTGQEISSLLFTPVGGGSINDTFGVIANGKFRFFLKINSASKFPNLFEKERNGLEFLGKQKILQVPLVVACTEIEHYQILLLDWIEGGIKSEKFWKQFGEQLAALHRVSGNRFGYPEDNYMGALPQSNSELDNWIEFFIQHRLEPQINLAKKAGLIQAKQAGAFKNLYAKLNGIFNAEPASLVHGDLWSGNFMCNQNSEPVLIDPAIYFGHRSMDLAMTTLFGGFDKLFYESYHHHFPFPSNYREQWEVCNLYPLLIHLDLFGIGYLGQIETILRKFR